ncbi:hypothetical protein F4678DRAFT_463585 [Xylaria arbuscula]|nr:hypothetical protein F4678DRAFT_463585 [Xylaria arbuscula]
MAGHLSAPVNTWTSKSRRGHGEGRSESQFTWHISVWKETGTENHCSVILVGANDYFPVEGSKVIHGTGQPSMVHVLNHYKRMYDVVPVTPSPRDSDDENAAHGGAEGGSPGGDGRGSKKRWTKKVKGDEQRGYYYIDSQNNYCVCDESGNDIISNDESPPIDASN